jgi:hypothetical protein
MGKYYREHIGKVFNDGKIIVVDGGEQKGYVKVKCLVCAEDAELFGDGVFESPFFGIKSGCLPCGCSSKRRLNSSQYCTLVNRKIQKNDLQLNLLYICSSENKSFIVTLFCKVRGIEISMPVVSFLSKQFSLNSTKLVNVHSHILDFNRVNPDKVVWKIPSAITSSGTRVAYYCRICEGMGRESLYEVASNSLFNGKITPCQCTTQGKKLKPDEYIDRAKEIIGARDCDRVVGCIEGIDKRIKIAMLCEYHGMYSKHFSHLSKQSYDCPKCSKSNYGFDRTTTGYLYILHMCTGNKVVIGYGITNKPQTRLSTHRKNLNNLGYKILSTRVFEGYGTKVLSVENAIKALHKTGLIDCEGFRRESISIDRKEEVLKLCKTLKEII